MRSPVLPYGYDWLNGKLVVDPKEYRVVQKIVQLWQKGISARAIADTLNQQRVPTRMGKRWFHSSVNAVIKRHQQTTAKT
jgi:site-specific DNA recombinase